MNRIFRDSSYSIISSIINLTIALGSSILIARLLGPEGKGTITLVVQIAALGSTFLTFGLSMAYQYSLGKGNISLEEVNGHIIVQTLLIIALMVLFMIAGGKNLLGLITNSSLSQNLLIIAIIMLILSTIAGYVDGPLMALKDGVKLSSLYSISSTILYGFGIVLFTWILGWGVTGILIASMLGGCIKILFSWNKIFIRAVKTIKFNWLTLSKPLYSYGLNIMVSQFMLVGVLRIDTFIVNGYLGSGQLGIYSIAYTLAELVLLIPRGFGLAIFPQMNSVAKEVQITMMATTARINLLLVVMGSVLMILAGYPAIKLLYGSQFESAYIALLWILPGVLCMSLTYSSYHYFISSIGRPHILAITYGLGVLINIVSNILLIPLMGINGASLSSSLTYILITLTFILIISRKEKIPIKKIVILEREDLRIIHTAFIKFIIRFKEFEKLIVGVD